MPAACPFLKYTCTIPGNINCSDPVAGASQINFDENTGIAVIDTQTAASRPPGAYTYTFGADAGDGVKESFQVTLTLQELQLTFSQSSAGMSTIRVRNQFK